MNLISIDKPCKENWAEMSPVEQGAFCGKCQKSVIDFSNKTADEVKLILQSNHGKPTCGRFSQTQLNQINQDFSVWENQSTKTFQSKFIYAVLIGFGFTLFSCKTLEENKVIEEKIEMASTILEEVNTLDSLSSQSKPSEIANDGMDYLNNQDSDSATNFNLGQLDLLALSYDKVITINPGLWIMGDIAWGYPWISPDSENPINPHTSLVLDFNLPENELEKMLGDKRLTAHLEKKSNPNISSLIIYTELIQSLNITVFGPNGREKILNDSKVAHGNHTFDIDLSDYPRGTYSIYVQQGTLKKRLPIYHQG